MVAERLLSVDRVLIDAMEFLLEQTRKELERAAQDSDDASASGDLERARDMEQRLAQARRLLETQQALLPPELRGSHYYDVPGQEDS